MGWTGLSIFGLVWAVAAIAFPTSSLITDTDLTIDGRTAYFSRLLPFGPVEAEYRIDIIMPNNHECSMQKPSEAYYQAYDTKGNRVVTISFTMHEDLWECLDIGPPFDVVSRRTARFFRVLPTRPDNSLYVIEARGVVAPYQQYNPH